MPSEPTILFPKEHGVCVTPGWFTHAGTSHAMRTVVRVSLIDRTLPRRSWRVLFFSALPLVVLTGLNLLRERMPWWLAFSLFVASVLLALTAAQFAFVVRDRRRLEVSLSDGTRVVIERPGHAFLTEVHDALLRAMDWHHGGPAVPCTAAVSQAPPVSPMAAPVTAAVPASTAPEGRACPRR